MNFYHVDTLQIAEHKDFVTNLATQMGKTYQQLCDIDICSLSNTEEWCEQNDVDMLFISVQNQPFVIQKYLNACRNLRIPYVFMTPTMHKIKAIQQILVTVSLLEEEVYKAQILSHIGRYTQANIILLKAHDFGSKAQNNVNKIATSLKQFDLKFEIREAKKDSFNLHKEVTDRQKDFLSDLIMLTASRDYSIDDWIFGPAERHTIRHSQVPVLLSNPRGDLFSLCD